MNEEYQSAQFNWSNLRPAELERNPLSGQTVTIRSHGCPSLSFRGKEYKADPETKLIADVPVEAVEQIEGATYWTNGKSQQVRFDVIGRDSELTPSEKE